MHYFSKKILCMNCNKRFKFKMERSIPKYIDSTYDTKGKCERTIINEEFLLGLIERRYRKKFSVEEIQEMVDRVEVKSKFEFVIYFYNDESIVSFDNHFKF